MPRFSWAAPPGAWTRWVRWPRRAGAGALVLALGLALSPPAAAAPAAATGDGPAATPGDELEVVLLVRRIVTDDRAHLDPVVNRLAYLQDPAAPGLVADLLHHPAPRVRRNAAWVLGILLAPGTAPALVDALRDDDAEVRRDAAFALGRLGQEAAARPLTRALDDPDRLVRREAAKALARLEAPAAVPGLVRALTTCRSPREAGSDPDTCGDDLELEVLLIDALGRAGGPAALAPLRARLDRDSETVRLAALRALGRLGDTEARRRLLARLRADDPLQRVDAARILSELPGRWPVEPLAGALSDADLRVRLAAAEALGARDDPRGLSLLVSARRAGGEEAARAAEALARLEVDPARLAEVVASVGGEVDVLSLARRLDEDGVPFPERLVALSGAMKDVRYLDSPLGEGAGVDPDPLVRWDAVDCLTFVEQVLAAANAPGDAFLSTLLDLRYVDGRPAFGRRNHLMMHQWIPNNVAKGYLRDVARELAGDRARTAAKTLTAGLWEARRGVDLPLDASEVPLGTRTVDVVPLESFEALIGRIPSGTVLVVVRRDLAGRPYRVTHLGFVVQRRRRTFLRHAAKGQRLRVVDEDLRVFLGRNAGYQRWPVEGFALFAPLENRARVAALADGPLGPPDRDAAEGSAQP